MLHTALGELVYDYNSIALFPTPPRLTMSLATSLPPPFVAVPPCLFLAQRTWPVDHGQLRCAHQRLSVLHYHRAGGASRWTVGRFRTGDIGIRGCQGSIWYVRHQGQASFRHQGRTMRRDGGVMHLTIYPVVGLLSCCSANFVASVLYVRAVDFSWASEAFFAIFLLACVACRERHVGDTLNRLPLLSKIVGGLERYFACRTRKLLTRCWGGATRMNVTGDRYPRISRLAR